MCEKEVITQEQWDRGDVSLEDLAELRRRREARGGGFPEWRSAHLLRPASQDEMRAALRRTVFNPPKKACDVIKELANKIASFLLDEGYLFIDGALGDVQKATAEIIEEFLKTGTYRDRRTQPEVVYPTMTAADPVIVQHPTEQGG